MQRERQIRLLRKSLRYFEGKSPLRVWLVRAGQDRDFDSADNDGLRVALTDGIEHAEPHPRRVPGEDRDGGDHGLEARRARLREDPSDENRDAARDQQVHPEVSPLTTSPMIAPPMPA